MTGSSKANDEMSEVDMMTIEELFDVICSRVASAVLVVEHGDRDPDTSMAVYLDARSWMAALGCLEHGRDYVKFCLDVQRRKQFEERDEDSDDGS